MTWPTYILFSLFFLISNPASAQFFAGFSGGMNMATTPFTGDVNFPDSKFSTFFFGGIYSGYQLHEKWTLTADLNFSQKGYWSDYSELEVPDPYARYSYLDLVPQIEYHIHNNISLGAGMYVSRLLNDAYSTGSDDEWNTPDQAPFVSGMDAGAVASARFTVGDFFFFTRYHHGLVNIYNLNLTDVNGLPVNVIQRNSVFQVGVGYVFLEAKKDS